ncbi:MAG: hypothetical protein IJ254_02680 [Succinivibrio sp.]|nr:hypothetical protein [Succinivibrio sp.]
MFSERIFVETKDESDLLKVSLISKIAPGLHRSEVKDPAHMKLKILQISKIWKI